VDRWVRSGYLLMIFAVIGAMVAHNLLILRRKLLASLRDPTRTVVRMSRAARIQHGLVASSFILLVITGFALKFPDSPLTWLMGSSESVRRILHRSAACVLISAAIARWAAQPLPGSAIVQNITHAILVDPDGTPHQVAPAGDVGVERRGETGEDGTELHAYRVGIGAALEFSVDGVL